MTAVLPIVDPPAVDQLRESQDLRSAAVLQHAVDGIAAFYDSRAKAEQVALQLKQKLGLRSAQLLQLRPTDGLWVRFVLLARRWNRHPRASRHVFTPHLWSAALLGATAAGLAASVLVASDELGAWITVAAVLSGALVSLALTASMRGQQPQYRRFDREVRRQLKAGHWALLARDLPWSDQGRAMSLLRQHSLDWCAVSSAQVRR